MRGYGCMLIQSIQYVICGFEYDHLKCVAGSPVYMLSARSVSPIYFYGSR